MVKLAKGQRMFVMTEPTLKHIMRLRAKAAVKTMWTKDGRLKKVKVYEKLQPLLCWKCREEIEAGQKVFVRRSKNWKSWTRHYHLECWEACFVA